MNHGNGAPGQFLRPIVEAGRALRDGTLLALVVGGLVVGMTTDTGAANPYHAPVRYDANGCALPYPSDTAHVLQVAGQPESSLMTADVVGGGKGDDPHPAAERYRQLEAQHLGLHIFDATPIINQLEADDVDGHLSYTQYLTAAQKFMTNFGVEVRLATDDDGLAYKGKALTPAQLADPAMKATLLNMLRAYSNVPAEYVALGGEQHILLAGNLAQNGVAAYANTGYVHDTTVYDATLGISVQTYGHELGHLVDNELCGASGMSQDMEFAVIDGGNPALYTGQTWDTTSPNFTDFEVQDVQAYTLALQLAAKGNVAAACQLLDQQNAKAGQLTSWSEYHPDTAEAKAELYGELFDPETYVTMLDPRYTVMRKQFLFLLARLYTVQPNLADYFLAVARRPIVNKTATCDTGTIGNGGPATGGNPNDPTGGYGK
jgi:hypothetical protein